MCNEEVFSKDSHTKRHKECVGEYNRKQNSLKYGSQFPYAAGAYPDVSGISQLAPEWPVPSLAYPSVIPVGRPFSDPRNNPRLNTKRDEGKVPGLSPVRVAVFDIETTGLNAGFGVVLCAVVKLYGPDETRVFRADDYPAWQRGERANDRDLVAAILACLEQADIIIAHNGLRFDVSFLRTRAVIHDLPPVNFQKIIDPLQLARQLFRFPGNSLKSIQNTLLTPSKKTELIPEVWQRATMNGDKDAMDEIAEHCLYDVEVLEEIVFKLRGYIRKIDTLGSFRG